MNEERRQSFSYTVWMLGGGYLLYLAYSMYQSFEELNGVQIAAMGIFIFFGLFFIGSGLCHFRALDKAKKRRAKEEQKKLCPGENDGSEKAAEDEV